MKVRKFNLTIKVTGSKNIKVLRHMNPSPVEYMIIVMIIENWNKNLNFITNFVSKKLGKYKTKIIFSTTVKQFDPDLNPN